MDEGRTFALLVGIDAYPGPTPGPLAGCVRDVDRVQALLLGPLSVPPAAITRLVSPVAGATVSDAVPSAPATREAIVGALRGLASDHVTRDDRVVVYYAGLGAGLSVRDAQGVSYREALVPVDVVIDAQGVPRGLLFDVELRALLAAITARTDRVSLILDTGHSTGAVRGDEERPPTDHARVMPIHGVHTLAELALEDVPGTSHSLYGAVERCTVAAACLADEVAWEGLQPDGTTSGFFTAALVKHLEASDPARLSSIPWGRIWPQVMADVSDRRAQHPRLFGSSARAVFAGPPADGDPGFAVTFDGDAFRLEAGTLVGLTTGAVVGLYGPEPASLPSIGSFADLSARIHTVVVTEAGPAWARARVSAERPISSLPPGARGRLLRSGAEARLVVALVPPDDKLRLAISSASFIRFAEPGQTPDVTLERCADGDLALTDALFGKGDGPDEPVLLRIPPDVGTAAIVAALQHYTTYIAPAEMAQRCHGISAGALEVELLDLTGLPHDERTGLFELEGSDYQDPALPALARGADGFYELVAGRSAYCISVRNRSEERLYVTLLESGNSGRVTLLGGQLVEPGRRHVFWWHGTPGIPFANSITTGREVGIDRLSVIGTSSGSSTLDFFATSMTFRNVLAGVSFRDLGSDLQLPDRWAGSRALLRVHAAPAVTAPPPRVRRLALLVGIDRYSGAALRGCVNDARLIGQVLQDAAGFTAGDIRMLLDEDATRGAILKALDWLSASARADDTVVLFYAGHGRRWRDPGAAEAPTRSSTDDAADGALLPFDWTRGSADETTIPYRDLRAWTARLATRDVRIILDVSYAGNLLPPVNDPAAPGPVYLGACQADESTREFVPRGAGAHGGFTYFLAQALLATKPDTTFRQVFARVSAAVVSRFHQHPVLQGAIDRRAGFAGRIQRPRVIARDRNGVTIGAGAEGVTVRSRWAIHPIRTRDEAAFDPDDRVGMIEITEVGAGQAKAVILSESGPNAIAVGAVAVEEAHSYGEMRLRVRYVQGGQPDLDRVVPVLVERSELLRLVGPDEPYDVELRAQPKDAGAETPLVWAIVDPAERLLLPPLALTDTYGVGDQLERVARYQNVLGLRNPNLDSALAGRVELSMLRMDARGRWVVAEPDEKTGVPVFPHGAPFRLEIRNFHGVPVHISVLDFSILKTVEQVIPSGDEPLTRLEPGGLHVYESNAFVPRGFPSPSGVEVLKLIATTYRLDMRALFLQDGIRGQTRTPGSETVLWQLVDLALTGRGSRDPRPVRVPREQEWTTSEVTIEVRLP